MCSLNYQCYRNETFRPCRCYRETTRKTPTILCVTGSTPEIPECAIFPIRNALSDYLKIILAHLPITYGNEIHWSHRRSWWLWQSKSFLGWIPSFPEWFFRILLSEGKRWLKLESLLLQKCFHFNCFSNSFINIFLLNEY